MTQLRRDTDRRAWISSPSLLLILVAGISACSVPERRVSVPIEPDRVVGGNLAGDSRLELDIPVGELHIDGHAGDRVDARMTIRCEETDGRCASRARDTELRLRHVDDRWLLDTNRPRRSSYAEADVVTRIRLPSRLDLDVRFGYGSLVVNDHAGCLAVRMGAGEADIQMSRAAVRRVRLKADVGDTALRVDGHTLEGSRVLLVGSKVDWAQGPGGCEVRVELGAGDVSVYLD